MNPKEYYKERLLNSLNEQNNMNINELTAFTDQQLKNPKIERIQKHQMIRLRDIAAKHNAESPAKPKDFSFANKVRAQRIASLLRARGALAGVANDGVTITHNARQEPDGFGGETEVDKTAPIYPKSLLDIGYSSQLGRQDSATKAKHLRRHAREMRTKNRITESAEKQLDELRAFTDRDIALNPKIRTIAHDQLGRLRTIAANHNANPNRTADRGLRISNMMRTRGADVASDPISNTVMRQPFRRDENPSPVSHTTPLDSREMREPDRFRAAAAGGIMRSNRRKREKSDRNDALGVAAANKQGFKTPEGITEQNNMNIKEYYKEILNSEINEATPAEIQAHQISRLDRVANKFNGGEYGADLRKPRNLRAGRRIANLYKKAGVLGGFRPYSGLAGEDPVMIRTDTWPAYPEAIKNANAELKRDRGSNRTVGRKIRGFIKRTTGLE